jgi:hypothetical protein
MRLLGLDQAGLGERAGVSQSIVSRTVTGKGCDLGTAAKFAAAVGLDLVAMLGPYECGTCTRYGGNPPRGTMCLECGEEGARG